MAATYAVDCSNLNLFTTIDYGIFRQDGFNAPSSRNSDVNRGRAMASSDTPAVDAAPPINVAAAAMELRRVIYSHDTLTRQDMDRVFDLLRKAGRNPAPECVSLFCEASADFVVHQNTPRDYIPQDKADWLVAKLSEGGGISSKAEFSMLIDVMTHALDVPESLSAFALREIKTAITNGRRDAYTVEDHPAGVVTAADVEALRAVLYAATTGTACHVTQQEAEVLFDIAHATARAQVDPAFNELFARAVGNYLMAINVHVPSAAEALHREKWLDEEESMSGFLSRILHSVPSASFDVMKSPEEAFEDDIAERDGVDQVLGDESEKVTDIEADWVIAHLTREGELTTAEKRLLQFLGAEATAIPPALRSLVDKANAAVAIAQRA
jgi:hypothetical protein